MKGRRLPGFGEIDFTVSPPHCWFWSSECPVAPGMCWEHSCIHGNSRCPYLALVVTFEGILSVCCEHPGCEEEA